DYAGDQESATESAYIIIEIVIKVLKTQIDNVNYAKIEFIDNGQGVADIRKEEIFQREIKEDSDISGIGLGLSLVKKIIQSYNGQIWVEDRVKGDYTKGSVFMLLIPENL
ncbi:MAG: ATP-binding protein, partial [Promethearchaeota archaeon]